MRTPNITPREALLWVVLVGAVGLMVFSVTRQGAPSRHATAAPATEMQPVAIARLPVASSVHRTPDVWPDRADWEDPQVLVSSSDAPAGDGSPVADSESGCEMPFAPNATAGAPSTAFPSDAAGLCGVLRDAVTNGHGHDAAELRTRLVAMGATAVPAVSAMLQCGSEQVEVEAVRLLVQIGDTQGLALALGKLLTVPRDSSAYGLFLAAFADNRSAAVAQWLTDTLGKAQHADTRERMLDLLYAMRGPAAVAALEGAAISPADTMHAQDSVDSIATRHDPSETESLAALLESEHQGIREAAALGLAEVGSGAACQELAARAETEPACTYALASVSSSYAQETLLAMATDQTRPATVRSAAVQSLAGHSGYRVQTVLANAAVHEPNPTVAQAMQTAVDTINNNQVEARNNTPVAGCDKGELWF